MERSRAARTACQYAPNDASLRVNLSMAQLLRGNFVDGRILLDVNRHWVWLLEQSDSPCYPNTWLDRQKVFARWEPVLEEVSAGLAALALEA
ncbi:MAG TPA: hypothetical protein VIH96_07465 [Paraburkholderia sp.]|jgi:hypothetical protein